MIAWPEPDTFVLQHRPYRETSFLVRLLSQSAGLVRTLWRDTTPIYLFQPYKTALKADRDWPELGSVQVAGQVLRLSGKRSYMGLYLNEICAALLPPAIPDERFFGVYFSTLRALQYDDSVEPWLRFFEHRLLEAAGLGVDWWCDNLGHPVLAEVRYAFDGVNRFMPLPAGSAEGWAGEDIRAAGRFDFCRESTRRCARHVLRHALDYHLQGRSVRARELLYPASLEGRL